MLVKASLYTEMTSALSWPGVGAAVVGVGVGVGPSVQAIEIVLVALPSWDVITMVVVPGMLVAAVTTALAFVSVVVAATVGATVVPAGNSTE